MSIELRETAQGVVLPIKVSAGSRTSGLRGVQNGALKVSVTVAAEKGKANQAVVRLLAHELQIQRSSIEIISGTTSPRKQVLLVGMDVEVVRRKLAGIG